MNIQGAIENLAKAFIAFYIGCALIGRPDIPIKLILELRGKAIAGASASWGCPSAFNKRACREYNPQNYKHIYPR